MQKSTIDKTEETLVDMCEITVDNGHLMTIPEGAATAHTINLDKVNYITYDGEEYEQMRQTRERSSK